ncbi:hypothetical protein QBC39DRAFT_346924, partial [Podospora conica]
SLTMTGLSSVLSLSSVPLPRPSSTPVPPIWFTPDTLTAGVRPKPPLVSVITCRVTWRGGRETDKGRRQRARVSPPPLASQPAARRIMNHESCTAASTSPSTTASTTASRRMDSTMVHTCLVTPHDACYLLPLGGAIIVSPQPRMKTLSRNPLKPSSISYTRASDSQRAAALLCLAAMPQGGHPAGGRQGLDPKEQAVMSAVNHSAGETQAADLQPPAG